MPQLVCAGHVNWDVTLFVEALPRADEEVRVARQRQAGGGSASNTAAVLAGLGMGAVLLGSVGDDEYGHLARRELTAAGVDCTYLQRAAERDTTVKHLLVGEDGEVAVLANEGANEAFEAADLPDATLASADHLHLTSQAPDTAAALARAAAEAGVPVSVDPGRRLAERDYAAVLEVADLLFLNEREAESAEAGALPGTDATVVRKLGAGGAALERSEGTLAHPGFDVEPVDTTGAGDAFAAGFLAARLRGSAPEDALAVGNACGALAANVEGARPSIDWAAVEELLEG